MNRIQISCEWFTVMSRLFLIVLVVTLAWGFFDLPVAAQSPLTPEDVARIRTVRSVQISPVGKRVAWTLSVPRALFTDDDGKPWSELHVSTWNGASRPYVSGEVNVNAVAWTPDGKGISFLAKRGKDEYAALYVIPVDGGEARKRFEHETAITAYSWAPDGKSVAFLAKDKDDEEEKKRKDQGFKAEIYEEQDRPVHVFIGTLPSDETGQQTRKLDLPGSASELHWSPAGSRLVVCLAPSARIDDHYMARSVHIIDVESGEITATLSQEGKKGTIVWSPDGTRLAMIGGVDVHDPQQGRLMVAPAEGGVFKDLIPGYLGHVRSIAWKSADTLVYIGAEGTGTRFGWISLDGKEKKTILHPGEQILSGLSLSTSGNSAAFTVETQRHPRDLFVMADVDKEPRRLTTVNLWLENRRLARQETIEFEARDGLKIQGVLIHPLDEVEGQRYPLILSVHGGPESHRSDGWLTTYSRPGQVAAAKGYAVFYPNYRGSTGRGVEFSRKGQADYAGGEFNDLVDAIGHLSSIGLVDSDKVGITGGSYGGYASAWGATALSEHFAASVMFVGISNLVSKAGTTDIPNEMYLVHARRWPWKHWDFFRERSPIFHVENARTPLLILGGTDDTRVHPGQSLELYRYLKLVGQAPVRWVRYPGEGHGNRKAAARYDYNLRMLRWMDHFLQGEGGDPPAHELELDSGAVPGSEVKHDVKIPAGLP